MSAAPRSEPLALHVPAGWLDALVADMRADREPAPHWDIAQLDGFAEAIGASIAASIAASARAAEDEAAAPANVRDVTCWGEPEAPTHRALTCVPNGALDACRTALGRVRASVIPAWDSS